ncbi:MAG: hypothetical protein WD060_01940 [Pirellulales bacterium]
MTPPIEAEDEPFATLLRHFLKEPGELGGHRMLAITKAFLQLAGDHEDRQSPVGEARLDASIIIPPEVKRLR